MTHDFKRFPELTNSQMDLYYFESPHQQITEMFEAQVIDVHDGDTIKVRCEFRDFDFPIRIAELAAPELDEVGGRESQQWLQSQLLGKDVLIFPTKTRVEKWGRLLANVMSEGFDMSELSVMNGQAITWEQRKEGQMINFNATLEGLI